MTSLERMSHLVDRDICNSSVHASRSATCIEKCCNGFRAGKQLAASCLHQVNCKPNPNSKHGTTQPKTWP